MDRDDSQLRPGYRMLLGRFRSTATMTNPAEWLRSLLSGPDMCAKLFPCS